MSKLKDNTKKSKPKKNIWTEYDYDYEDLIADDEECILCPKRKKIGFEVSLCRDCGNDLFMSKTKAKKIYKLRDDDFENMNYEETRMNFGGTIAIPIYYIKEIRLKAIEKKFNLGNPSRNQYLSCIEEIMNELDIKLYEKDKRREEKERKLNAEKLSRESILTGLKTKYKLTKGNYRVTESKSYIESNEPCTSTLIQLMIIDKFLDTKTTFPELLTKPLPEKPGPKLKMYINPMEKRRCLAIKQYVKDYGKDKVPALIRYWYKSIINTKDDYNEIVSRLLRLSNEKSEKLFNKFVLIQKVTTTGSKKIIKGGSKTSKKNLTKKKAVIED
jgi:hypothetical protein